MNITHIENSLIQKCHCKLCYPVVLILSQLAKCFDRAPSPLTPTCQNKKKTLTRNSGNNTNIFNDAFHMERVNLILSSVLNCSLPDL